MTTRTVALQAASALTLVVATPALSQPASAPVKAAAEDQAANLSEVVVTGLRASQRRALAIKRAREEIVEAVTAEEIGKLPDYNIAEAIQRLTGVQVAIFAGGEAGEAVIRGIQTTPGVSPVRVELNNNSTSAGGRSIDVADLPSAMVSSVEVYKTPSADQVEGALAGVIKLKTLTPGQIRKRALQLTARETYYDYAGDHAPSFGLFYGDAWSFGGGRVGFLVNGSYSDYRVTTDRLGVGQNVGLRWRPTNLHGLDVDRDGVIATATGNPASKTEGFDDAVAVPQTFVAETSETSPRQGFVTSAIGFEREDLSLSLTGIYNWLDRDNRSEQLSAGNLYQRPADPFAKDWVYAQIPGLTQFDTNAGAFRPVPSFVRGTFDQAPLTSNTYTTRRDFEALNLAGDAEWRGRVWQVSAGAAYINGHDNNLSNRATFNAVDSLGAAPDLFLDFGEARKVPTVVFSGSAPGAAFDLTSPDNFILHAVARDISKVKARETSAKLNVSRDFKGALRSLHAGLRLAENRYQSDQYTRRFVGAEVLDYHLPVSRHPDLYVLAHQAEEPNLYNYSGRFPRDWITPEVPFGTPESLFNYAIGPARDQFRNPPFTFTASYAITEKTSAAYVMGRIGQEGDLLTGNFGVRYVRTQLMSQGSQSAAKGGYEPITIRRTYDNWLPSLNLSANLRSDLRLRFSAFKAMVRPDLSSLRAARQVNYSQDGDATSASGGNPYLKAQTADGLDLAAEWYFAPASLLSAGVFHRRIRDPIATRTTQVDLDPVTGDIVFDPTGAVTYSTPVNYDLTHRISGFEAAFQSTFDFLPGLLKDAGVNLNYTFIDSDLPDDPKTPYREEFTNIARHSFNAQLFYERGPFSSRIAWNWRGRSAKSSNLTGAPEYQHIWASPESRVDLSASYDFNERLQAQASWRNAFGWTRTLYVEDKRQFGLVTDDSSQISVGFRWRM